MSIQQKKILLIVDYPHWISNKIAINIIKETKGFVFFKCTITTWLMFVKSFPDAGSHFHVVHFLTPHLFKVSSEYFPDTTAIVSHVHHLEDNQHDTTIEKLKLIATVSDQWENIIKSKFQRNPQDFHRIGNGVCLKDFPNLDPNRKLKARRYFSIKSDKKIVGFIGKSSSNSNGRKGIDIFIKVCLEILKEEDILIFIVGEGWESYFKESSIESDNIKHISYLNSEKKLRFFYQSLDVYLITSRIEGGPVPLLEAMASGSIVLSTDVGVASEAITSGENGFLLNSLNVGEIVQTLISILNISESLREKISQEARRTIEEKFSWPTVMVNTEFFYRKASANTSVKKSNSRFLKNFSKTACCLDDLELYEKMISNKCYKAAFVAFLRSLLNLFYARFFCFRWCKRVIKGVLHIV